MQYFSFAFLQIFSKLHICSSVFKPIVCYNKKMFAQSKICCFYIKQHPAFLPEDGLSSLGKCSHQNNGSEIVCLHPPKIIWKVNKKSKWQKILNIESDIGILLPPVVKCFPQEYINHLLRMNLALWCYNSEVSE